MKTSLNNTTSCKREAKIRKFRRSDQQQCRHLYEVSRALFGSSRIHYWILCEKYVQYSTGCGLIVVLLSSLYSIWILLLYLLLVLACAMMAQFKISDMQERQRDMIVDSLRTDLADIEKYYMNQEGSCMWVADVEGEIVGMVGILQTEQGQAELRRLAVLPDYRRQGVATKLMKELLSFARGNNYVKVILESSNFSVAANNLCKKQGFIIVNVEPSYEDLTRIPFLTDMQTVKFECRL